MFKIYIANNNHKYEIHNNGDVYSCSRISNGCAKGIIARKKLLQKITKSGYLQVSLGRGEKNISVHRLVAKTFIPNDTLLEQVNHIDGDKTNNDVSNLEWCTRSENMIHSHSVLRQRLRLKTTEEDRSRIIDMFNSGMTMKDIQKISFISYNTVKRIISGAEYSSKTSNCTYSMSNKTRSTNAERIDNAVKIKIKQLREKGNSYGNIAKELKVSKYTVAKECGWQRKSMV